MKGRPSEAETPTRYTLWLLEVCVSQGHYNATYVYARDEAHARQLSEGFHPNKPKDATPCPYGARAGQSRWYEGQVTIHEVGEDEQVTLKEIMVRYHLFHATLVYTSGLDNERVNTLLEGDPATTEEAAALLQALVKLTGIGRTQVRIPIEDD